VRGERNAPISRKRGIFEERKDEWVLMAKGKERADSNRGLTFLVVVALVGEAVRKRGEVPSTMC